MTENENVSIWSKTTDELTVADQLKVSAVFVAVSVAVPVAFLGSIAAANAIKDKLRQRKLAKETQKIEQIVEG